MSGHEGRLLRERHATSRKQPSRETPCSLRKSGDHGGSRAAVAQVLDSVSWELFGLVMGCLEQSTTSSRIGRNGSSSSSSVNGDMLSAAADTPRQAEEIAALAEKLALGLAETFSPKELHIMALEHLHAYSEKRYIVGTRLCCCCLLPVMLIFCRVVSSWLLSRGELHSTILAMFLVGGLSSGRQSSAPATRQSTHASTQ